MDKDTRCSVMVSGEGTWGAFHQHQCHKKAVVERNGKPYCKIHDPEYMKAKSERINREYERRYEEQRKQFKRERLINEIFYDIDTDIIENNLETLKEIVSKLSTTKE